MSEATTRPPTIGEYRVGIAFNPSGDRTVSALKAAAALFIDLCAAIQKPEDEATRSEVARLVALAITHAEDAAMWAVKAATKPTR